MIQNMDRVCFSSTTSTRRARQAAVMQLSAVVRRGSVIFTFTFEIATYWRAAPSVEARIN